MFYILLVINVLERGSSSDEEDDDDVDNDAIGRRLQEKAVRNGMLGEDGGVNERERGEGLLFRST